MTKDLSERLASLRIEMAPQTAERHLGAIHRELVDPAPMTVRPRRRPRRRLVAVLAAVFILLLPAAAIASDDSVPGDVLYPVKRSAEWAWSFIDPGIRARHRIEELETVIVRNAPLEEVNARLADAEAAVDADLLPRLERAREQVRAQYGPGGSEQGGRGEGSGTGPGSGGSSTPGPATTAPSVGGTVDSGGDTGGSAPGATGPADSPSPGNGESDQERDRSRGG